MRALEHYRASESRILDDPYAQWFLSPLGKVALATWVAAGRLGDLVARVAPGGMAYVVARHRFIDECLHAALQERIEQIVLLGSGYDSRAYRFAADLGGRPVFEVDYPATSRRKAQIVMHHARDLPPVDVRRVEIDFEADSLADRLAEAGFRMRRRTFFVWEGVSMYLTRAAVKSTLATIRQITAPRSHLAMDFWNLLDSPDLLASAFRLSSNLMFLLGEPVTFALHHEDTPHFLRGLGFRVLDLAKPEDLRRRYVRDGRGLIAGSFLVHAVSVARK